MTKHCTGKLTLRLVATFVIIQYESIADSKEVSARIHQSNINIIGNTVGGYSRGFPTALITCE